MVFVLFMHRLVGLMLIAVVFPLGSWVNNESDVGGPPATPHIPQQSPLRATHGHPGQPRRAFKTKPSLVLQKHRFACKTLEKIGWFFLDI